MSSVFQTHSYDIVIVGGGIIGLATAREFLLRNPRLRLLLLEKETRLAVHQTGHNSGVIHTGIYYKPGSAKALACVAGHQAMIDFCQERDIPFKRCGKVIVALDDTEKPRLHELYQRGITNGVQGLELIDPPRLHEIEPNAAGIQAIFSPNTGIINYVKVADAYSEDIRRCGGEIVTGTRVASIETRQNNSVLFTNRGEVEANFVVTCAGLYSDKISQAGRTLRIVPFRGDYYRLRPERAGLVNALIYPVPDPGFPFLGVHFSRELNDEVWVGPNAVLAFAREGYRRWQVNLPELLDTLTFTGFWKMAARYWKTGMLEMYRDYIKSAYVKTAQRYVPTVTAADFEAGPSGVRAQALDANGNLVDDFVIKHGPHIAHVQNAPSPAATSSLVIARLIVDEMGNFS